MTVGVCVVQIHLPGAGSLKDKRQVLRSLKDHLRDRYNVAVAEIEHQDLWQRAAVGIVGIASARAPLEKMFQEIQGEVERRVPGEVLSCDVDFLS